MSVEPKSKRKSGDRNGNWFGSFEFIITCSRFQLCDEDNEGVFKKGRIYRMT